MTARRGCGRWCGRALAGRAKPGWAPGFPGRAGRCRAPPGSRCVPPVSGTSRARNPQFTGRGSELGRLARAAGRRGRGTVHSVHGMGGVGKTQLATEYAHAHATDYDLVWWIAAEEPAAIPDQFAALAASLGLDLGPAADPEALRAQVHDQLRTVPGWLLIFDNADQVKDIWPWLPGGPLPPGVPGHVIVTTRRGGFAAMGPVLDLDVIGLPDAVRILQARVPRLDQETAEQIAGELGRLPLALEQAAAWLDRSRMPGREYLELLRSRGADLYARGQVSDRADTIATLWDISVDRISRREPGRGAAAGHLRVPGARADPAGPVHQPPGPAAWAVVGQPPPTRWPSAMSSQILVDYSLAKRTPAGLQLHRLVQATIRARDSGPQPVRQHLGQVLPVAQDGEPQAMDLLAVALRLLRADAPAQIMGAPQDWPRWVGAAAACPGRHQPR